MDNASFFVNPDFQILVNFIRQIGLDYDLQSAVFDKLHHNSEMIRDVNSYPCGLYASNNAHATSDGTFSRFIYNPTTEEYLGFNYQYLSRFVKRENPPVGFDRFGTTNFCSVPQEGHVIDANYLAQANYLEVNPEFPVYTTMPSRITFVFFRASQIFRRSYNGELIKGVPRVDEPEIQVDDSNFEAIRQAGYDVLLDPLTTLPDIKTTYYLLQPRTQVTRTVWIEFPFGLDF